MSRLELYEVARYIQLPQTQLPWEDHTAPSKDHILSFITGVTPEKAAIAFLRAP